MGQKLQERVELPNSLKRLIFKISTRLDNSQRSKPHETFGTVQIDKDEGNVEFMRAKDD